MQLEGKKSQFSFTKIKLFAMIAVIISVGTIPITFSHITHQHMIYHIILHIASLIIAVFLSFIAVAAYLRDGRTRLLFMSFGFITLAILEGLMLLSATGNLNVPIIPAINVELSHLVLLLMITLFGIGILKVN
jgi:hypothetical protein